MSAFSFELGKCLSEEIQDRMLVNLANVDGTLSGRGREPGKPARRGSRPGISSLHRPCHCCPPNQAPIDGRVVGIFAGDGVDASGAPR